MNKLIINSMITPSLAADKFTHALIEAVEIQLRTCYKNAIEIYNLVTLEDANDKILDTLAYEKHVDFYTTDLPKKQKIALVRNAYLAHIYKGTIHALDLVFESLELDGQITEWFDYDGEPYTFRANIKFEQVGITEESYKILGKLINHYKNVRSDLELIVATLLSKNNIYVSNTLAIGNTLTIYPSTPEHLTITSPIYSDSATHSVTTLTIGGPHEEI